MKKRIWIIFMISAAFFLLPNGVSFADDGSPEGGEVTTNGKIMFYEEESSSEEPSSSTSSSTLPSKETSEGKKSIVSLLPQTDETNGREIFTVFGLLLTGCILLIFKYRREKIK